MSIVLNTDITQPESHSINLLREHYPEVRELSGEGWELDCAFNICANGKDEEGNLVKVALKKINAELEL